MAGRYDRIIEKIFRNHHRKGVKSFEFEREEMETVAAKLGIKLPKNLGDIVYSFRFRKEMPASIRKTQPRGLLWTIRGAGIGKYEFALTGATKILPRAEMVPIKIPDATPEIIAKYAMSDEQALLAKLRYNRIVDMFLGITAYSLQSHLRTTVAKFGQMEVDEVYVGVSKNGAQYVIPVQAKAGNDSIGTTQAEQDIEFCAKRFPGLQCRCIAAQFMDGGIIAILELTNHKGSIKVVDERHYELVPASEITDEELVAYRKRDAR
jgi:hypothetical protein